MSQRSLGNMGYTWDFHVPAETSQSKCPSHPKGPLGMWEVLGTPMSQHGHQSSTVLPIPKYSWDSGISSGLPRPSRDITDPQSFLYLSQLGTGECPRDLTSQQGHHSPTVLLIPKSPWKCGMSSGLPYPIRDLTVPLTFLSLSTLGTVECPRDTQIPSGTSQSHCPHF